MPNTQARNILSSMRTTLSQLRSESKSGSAGLETSSELAGNFGGSTVGRASSAALGGAATGVGNSATRHLDKLDQLISQLETQLQ